MLAAVIQLCSTPHLKTNLTEADRWMTAAVVQGAKLLVLPENFSFMGYTHHSASKEEQQRHQYREDPENGPSLIFLRDFAKKHKVWIVGGSIPLAVKDSMKITNTCFVVDDQGQVQGRYDKIHLFDANLGGEIPYRESNLVQAGETAVLVDTPFGTIGLTICYDLRFPELFRALSAQGATILTIPSAFTLTTGRNHWELLVRARAVENFAYVLAAGQGGKHLNGRHTYGHSMVVEPWGKIVAQCPKQTKNISQEDGDEPGFALAEIQSLRAAHCRTRIPCLKHRRLRQTENPLLFNAAVPPLVPPGKRHTTA